MVSARYMILKTKLIVGYANNGIDSIDTQVNEFLKNIDPIHVVDIKFTTEKRGEYSKHHVLIIYQE